MYKTLSEQGYQKLDKLGKGSTARVYKAVETATGLPVTLKIIPKLRVMAEPIRITRELTVPALLGEHKNIASLITSFEDSRYYYIVSEWINGGITLEQYDLINLQMTIKLDLIYQLLDVYEYMHLKSVVHRDIKPDNVIMKGNVPIVIDFDLSCWDAVDSPVPCSGVVGTPLYAAPEIILHYKNPVAINYFAADIYSVGILLYFVANQGQLPYQPDNIAQLREMLTEGSPQVSSSGIAELDEVIMAMIEKEPTERLSLSEAKLIVQRIIKSL